jgi:hypothetical protein
MLRDFRKLGITNVAQLARSRPSELYLRLSKITRHRQDPCVFDTFQAAVAQAKDPKLPAQKRKWWYWSRLRLAGKIPLPKVLLPLLLILASFQPTWADQDEMPNFGLMVHAGAGVPTGFMPGEFGPHAGIWMGISMSDRFDGLWGLDYYTLPNIPMTITQSNFSGPLPSIEVQPTDDVAFSVNLRWYLSDKWDYVHHRYAAVPYLLAGIGMDAVVDQDPRLSTPFWDAKYDLLFGMNLGAGMDFPMDDGRSWSIYAESLDHLIYWQGLTQIFAGHVGVRFMLDSAHVDPFR